GVRLRIRVFEYLAIIPEVLDQAAIGNDADTLKPVRTQQILCRGAIIFGQQGALGCARDVTPEASRRVAVSAQADIVSAQRIVVGERPCASAHGARRGARIRGHPEAVEVAHPIVRPARGNGFSLVLDENRALQLRTETERQSGGRIDIENAAGGRYPSGTLRFHRPAGETVLKVILLEKPGESISRI